MEALISAHPAARTSVASAQGAAVDQVVVVARDNLSGRRVREALAGASIEVLELAVDLASLSELASSADAILLVGLSPASERRALIREASSRFPDSPVILVAAAKANALHKAIEAGAAGVVYDDQVEAALPATVRAVRAGQIVVPRELRRHATRPVLSQRERQTLALVVMGLTNRQIAARLFLAESTVKTHLTSIFGKLGVGSRSEAVALVLDPDQKLGFGILGLSPGASLHPTGGGQQL